MTQPNKEVREKIGNIFKQHELTVRATNRVNHRELDITIGMLVDEVVACITQARNEAKIEENMFWNDLCHRKTDSMDSSSHRVGSPDFVERITELRKGMEGLKHE